MLDTKKIINVRTIEQLPDFRIGGIRIINLVSTYEAELELDESRIEKGIFAMFSINPSWQMWLSVKLKPLRKLSVLKPAYAM